MNSIVSSYFETTKRRSLIILIAAFLLVILSLYAVTIGSYSIEFTDIVSTFIFGEENQISGDIGTIIWDYRLPRVIMAVFAGASLATAGTVMQAILKNPLASPFTLGIASAAGFGASLAIVLGAGFATGGWLLAGNAFLFTMIASFIVYGLAQLKGLSSETMIMAGIAIMYLFSSLTSLLQYLGTSDDVNSIVFWMLGSLSRASWETDIVTVCCFILVFPVFIALSGSLNSLAAGDDTARSLGVNVGSLRVISLALSSLLTASVICFTGTIGFIGLVAPHIARMILGGDQRFLLPASAVLGALILLLADCFARTILSPQILPIGLMTSFIGVPFFVYLFMKRRENYW